MRKIKTIFDRDWEGDRKVVDKYVYPQVVEQLKTAKATEKLDGTNIRLTLRGGLVVRVEKRCNPSKIQKHNGIEEPWYVDASEGDPQDKYIFEAVKAMEVYPCPDGEWSGEALGPMIQGNPLKLEHHVVVLFSLGMAPEFFDVPTTYNELKAWLPLQKSKFGNDCGIEGIVWHCENGDMFKIKVKDF
jgi:hypothetical protein